MTGPSRTRVAEAQRLSRYLRALSASSRLLVLRQLRVPRTASSIVVPPSPREAGSRQGRPISRQAVQKHLDKLCDVGLARARTVHRGRRELTEYVMHHARLYLVIEELRRLALVRPTIPVDTADDTPSIDDEESLDEGVDIPNGPCLVLAKGPVDGVVYALEGRGPWRIGRRRDVDVSIPYDPFVSSVNTEVRRTSEGFAVRALEESRHGTRLNWRLLRADEEARLTSGDLVAVGRSVLAVRGV